jgi:Outer membrane protein beta-barrel domain
MSMMKHFTFRKTASGPGNAPAILRVFVLVCLVSFTGIRLHAQAIPTASAQGILQIGGVFDYANSDYDSVKFKGYGFYTTFDFRYHVGIEGEFHQINDPDSARGVYERTYEIGPRYVMHYGRYRPYGKIMYGRGVFNYPNLPGDPSPGPTANLAYNLAAIGVGLDYIVIPAMNVRAEYEYQSWFGFPPNGITPQALRIGVAYRFH